MTEAAQPQMLVPGLRDTVELRTDRWGVTHIRARSSQDAYRAQGWVVARDRSFQIDLWLRRGLGRLAEVLGPEYVERDRAARLFLFRGDQRQEWLSYSSGTRLAMTAFVEGIN